VTYRLARIVEALSPGGDEPWSSGGVCEATREVLGMSGAGVMIWSGEVPSGTLCTSGEVSTRIEELQYTLGEGPCVDACRSRDVVLVPDLVRHDALRWMGFAPLAIEAGVRALFAFPLQVGGAGLGALDLYRDEPGSLTDEQHADALVVADVVARWVVDVQAEAPPGTLAQELSAADFHFVVHNAAGAVSVQLGVSIAEAMIRLRAYAFSNDRPLQDVAEDVMARRLRLQ
jgi:hypothetical protein